MSRHDVGIVGYGDRSEIIVFIIDLKTAAQSEKGEEEKYTVFHEKLFTFESTPSEYLNGEKFRTRMIALNRKIRFDRGLYIG